MEGGGFWFGGWQLRSQWVLSVRDIYLSTVLVTKGCGWRKIYFQTRATFRGLRVSWQM